MAAPWVAASWMDSYFLVGCSLGDCFLKKMAILLLWTSQKNWLFYWLWTSQLDILLTLNKSKIKLTTKLPWEKLDAYALFFLAITSCHRHSTLASQTCEGLHQLWALPRHLAFFWFSMLRHPVFNSLTCDLQDTMPHQRSPTLIPREAEDFPRGGNHSKHVPLPTYLGWLQPISYNS